MSETSYLADLKSVLKFKVKLTTLAILYHESNEIIMWQDSAESYLSETTII